MRFRKHTFNLGLLFLFSVLSVYSDDFFPVGVWYGGGKARAPMLVRDPAPERDAWKHDLQTIKSLGFNSIKCWIDWASTEPEAGRFYFNNLEQLLTLADEVGLRVIVQIYADSAPEWLGNAYPDAAFVTDKGQTIESQAAPGRVEARFLESNDNLLFIGTNHSDSEQTVDFQFPATVKVEKGFNLETEQEIALESSLQGPKLSHRFDGRDVLIVRLKK